MFISDVNAPNVLGNPMPPMMADMVRSTLLRGGKTRITRDHRVNMENRKMTLQKTSKSESVYEAPGTGLRYDQEQSNGASPVLRRGPLTVDWTTDFQEM